MKIIILSLPFIFLAFCITNKESQPVFLPSDNQIQIAIKRWPNTVLQDLKDGQNTYITKCTQCHKANKIISFNERKWLHEIDDMAPRAELSSEEKQKLTKFILSFLEENKK